ncbi:MAG: TonB-dependent receptor [Vicinamibacterales bacterium]
MRRSIGLVLLVCTFGLLQLPLPALAQSSASISGTVRDPQGDSVPVATVTVVAPAAGIRREVTSGADGTFDVPGLLPALRYEVTATAPGFSPGTAAVAGLTAGERRVVVVVLPVERVAVDVEVVATAAARTSTPELGGNLSGDQIRRVPLNGRDLLAAAYLVPGAAPARGFYNLAPRLTINGASSLATNYTVDGFDNTDLFLGGPKVPVTIASTDGLEVMVNGYSAEYGRTGNGVFAVTTRSGSNQPAGGLFYTWRPGAALDAPNFFAPRDSAGRVIDDSFRRHQGGGYAGGAVVEDRIFYFADVEITRERQDAILTSPVAAGLAPTAFRSQTVMGKLDGRWSDAHLSTLRLHFSDLTHDGDAGFIGGLTLPSAGLQVSYRNQFAAFTHRAFIGRGVNESGVQVGQLRSDWRPAGAGPRVVVTDRGASVATIGAVSDSFLWTETDVQARSVYTWVAGRHTVRAGGDVLRGDFDIRSAPGARGAYVVDIAGRPVRPAGLYLDLADLPRDATVLSYSQSFVNPRVRRAQTLAAVFVEDVVRPTGNLTVTTGLRWDYDSSTKTPVNGGDLNNVAPRLGVTWTPRGSARHQLRGGYGVFYERIPFAVVSDTIFNDPDGGAVSVTFAPGTPFEPPPFPETFPRDALAGLAVSQLPPRNVQAFDPDLRSPWTSQLSGGYACAASPTLELAVDVVRARGHNLIRRIDVNAPASIAAGMSRSVAAADATRPVPPVPGGVRLVEQDQSSGHSAFDGLYLTARRVLAGGVAFDVAYTLSRVLNDTDDINFRPVDARQPDAEWGPSLNDRRHVLAVNGLVRVGEWVDVVPVLFLSSGQPLNVTTGRDDNGDTIFNDRPAGVARNSERTSGFAQLDVSLLRELRLGAARLQLRADVFNVFNRTNFSGFFNYGASGVRPDESGTLAFQPTAAGPARQFQFAAALRF